MGIDVDGIRLTEDKKDMEWLDGQKVSDRDRFTDTYARAWRGDRVVARMRPKQWPERTSIYARNANCTGFRAVWGSLARSSDRNLRCTIEFIRRIGPSCVLKYF